METMDDIAMASAVTTVNTLSDNDARFLLAFVLYTLTKDKSITFDDFIMYLTELKGI